MEEGFAESQIFPYVMCRMGQTRRMGDFELLTALKSYGAQGPRMSIHVKKYDIFWWNLLGFIILSGKKNILDICQYGKSETLIL